MKYKSLLATLVAVGTLQAHASSVADGNLAYQDSKVRITLISPGAVRLEYQPDGRFIDNPSFIAVSRDYPNVKFTKRETSRQVELKTSVITLIYKKGTGAFTSDNLHITSVRRKGTGVFSWHPGLKDTLNLKGTYRTLDGYDGEMRRGERMPIEDGLLSRSGWTIIDDSEGFLFDNSDWPWVQERKKTEGAQDWYFLGYGTDYKQALRDFTLFSGRVPLPPRYAFGYWWSRYWHYADNDLRDLVKKFRQYDIPLDVLVVDMDWHYINDNLGGWTGYSWNRRLFPDPDGFVHWLKSEGLKITMNLHPADGIKTWENRWPQMAEAMGTATAERKDIPWQGSDKRFMTAWYGVMLRPLEQQGVDFWWLDWQQFPNDKRLTKLSNTWWINYTTFTDMVRHRTDRRPMLYHRWGGLGNHRYQIGFSGDALITWASLDFQPYFNSTASNVLYGYWSHDIGGHMNADHIDPELYIRWMQFGALSPILRTHSSKSEVLNKEPWAFENQYTEILRDIIRLRYTFAPYIYTMSRKTYDEALPLCRPLYYEAPSEEESYQHRNTYYFGDDMLMDPITAPMQNGRSVKRIWLPAGSEWYEVSSGTLLDGGQTVERNFHLDEMPLYVRAGSIIPTYGDVQNLERNDETYILRLYPSSKPITRHATIYEDNGNSQDYATQYATTALTATHAADGSVTVIISPRQGSYQGMPVTRKYQLRVEASAIPERVTIDGKETAWTYDGITLSLLIDVPDIDCSHTKNISVSYPSDTPSTIDGLLGRMKRTRENVLALKRSNARIIVSESLGILENTGRMITYHPEQFRERIAEYNKVYSQLREILTDIEGIKNTKITPEEVERFIQATY